MVTPPGANALLLMVTVWLAGPVFAAYLIVMTHVPPPGIFWQLSLSVNVPALENVAPVVVRGRLPVFRTVVTCVDPMVVNFGSNPVVCSSFTTVPFRSVTYTLPEPSRVMPVGLSSPVSGSCSVRPPEEWLLGTHRTRWSLSVMNMSPFGSKAKPAGELSAHVVTVVESHGARENTVGPGPLRATSRISLGFPSPISRLAPGLSIEGARGSL